MCFPTTKIDGRFVELLGKFCLRLEYAVIMAKMLVIVDKMIGIYRLIRAVIA
jgi:hypothetical protein